jgi:hypothetical protein
MTTSTLSKLPWLVLSCLLAAGCNRPPDEPAAEKNVAALFSTADVCTGQPDYSQVPGCEGEEECGIFRCMSGACAFLVQPGRACGDRGTCQEDGSCKEPPSCEERCDSDFETCQRGCSPINPGCKCVCENIHYFCLNSCGIDTPPPKDCEFGAR